MNLNIEVYEEKHRAEIKTYSELSKYYKDVLRNKRPMGDGETRSMLDRKCSITKLKLAYLYYSYAMVNDSVLNKPKACVKATSHESILNINNIELIKYIKDMEDFKTALIYSSNDASGNGLVMIDNALSTMECIRCGAVGKFTRLKQTYATNTDSKPTVQCKECSVILYT